MTPPVYPRARGGAGLPASPANLMLGLSPRTRGSQATDRAGGQLAGSIPAHAGEPSAGPIDRRSPGVYPRARGGAIPRVFCASRLRGLSPRTRGSHPARPRREGVLGSIPAHAGEPTRSPQPSVPPRVYPRARGGAVTDVSPRETAPGLSPRTRGSRSGVRRVGGHRGSIPAHAGEPLRHGRRG